MAKVRVENVGPDKKLQADDRKQRLELSAEEKKLSKEEQDRIKNEREQQLKVEEHKQHGELLTIEVIEAQYNAQTGGDQDRPVDTRVLQPGEVVELDLTDKKRVSVRLS